MGKGNGSVPGCDYGNARLRDADLERVRYIRIAIAVG